MKEKYGTWGRQLFSKHKAVVETARNIIFSGDYTLMFDELLGTSFFL
jgi:hypothetical protein